MRATTSLARFALPLALFACVVDGRTELDMAEAGAPPPDDAGASDDALAAPDAGASNDALAAPDAGTTNDAGSADAGPPCPSFTSPESCPPTCVKATGGLFDADAGCKRGELFFCSGVFGGSGATYCGRHAESGTLLFFGSKPGDFPMSEWQPCTAEESELVWQAPPCE